ncbi:hypothetical protein [Kocuria rosea]|uniref:hypothetical protein n=1 Tax=Kocuria rosea TaxID=1275 RepID=UPI0023302FA8|nr:hypothetical protein [Kocuria rosea]
MVAMKYPPVPSGTLEQACKLIADLYSGSGLTKIIAETPLQNDPGQGNTKWRHLAHVVSSNQTSTPKGNALIAMVSASMRPDRIS